MSDPEPFVPAEPVGPQAVEIRRSVRIARFLLLGAIVGAVVAAAITTAFPIEEGATYSLWQVVGFVALIGAVLGLGLGAVVALVLQRVISRRVGRAVADRELESDEGPVGEAGPERG